MTTIHTKNTLPSSAANFLESLRNYLWLEDAERYADMFEDFVVSGGTHAAGSGLTKTPAPVTAYVRGRIIQETGSITYPDGQTTWVILHTDDTGNLTGFSRVSGTHYLIASQATQPTLPNDSTFLMKIVAAGGAVASVTDLRTLSPVAVNFGPLAYSFANLPTPGLNGRIVRVTDQTRGLWIDTGTQWVSLAGEVINAKEFGATGLDTGDDWPALQGALDILQGLGGGTLFIPRGTYRYSQRLRPAGGVHIRGAGADVTILKNTNPGVPGDDIGIDIRGVLGTNYAINTPTEGANTVTTTAAGDAGNFSPGNNIIITGPLFSGDYIPLFATSVVTADAGTGVVTLIDRLPRSDFSLVHKVTSLPQNVSVRDLTVAQAADIGIFAKYCRDVVIERVHTTEGVVSAGIAMVGVRDARYLDNRLDGGDLALHSLTAAQVIGNRISHAGTVAIGLEGGCEACLIGLNWITNPQNNGLQISVGSRRTTVLGNQFLNVPAGGFLGIAVDGNALGHGENLIALNTITSVNAQSGIAITLGNTTHDNIVVHNRIAGSWADGILLGAGNNLRNVIYPNSIQSTVVHRYSWISGSTAAPAGQRTMINPTFGATVTIDPHLADSFTIKVTSGIAFTISAPVDTVENLLEGWVITITVQNSSGGVMGVITWGAGQYKMSAWTNPANGFSRSITFRYSRAEFIWTEISRTPADVPN